MVLVIIITALVLLAFAIIEFVTIGELGSPLSNKDLSDFLDKIEKEDIKIDLGQKYDDKFRLYFRTKQYNSISQTSGSLLFPYYMDDIGVIPIWNSSYKRVKDMFQKHIEESSYTTNRRQKLGLK